MVQHPDPAVDEERRRHREVHHVAVVVPIEEQDAVAAVDALPDLDDRRRRRRREHVAERRAVREARADVAEECGLVAGAAAGDDSDAAFVRTRARNDAAPRRRDLDLAAERGLEPVDHLVDDVERIVEELPHPPADAGSPSTWPPSAWITFPVVHALSGETRNRTHAAMSSTWPICPSGTRRARSAYVASRSSEYVAWIGVSTGPGAMQLTPDPVRPELVRPRAREVLERRLRRAVEHRPRLHHRADGRADVHDRRIRRRAQRRQRRLGEEERAGDVDGVVRVEPLARERLERAVVDDRRVVDDDVEPLERRERLVDDPLRRLRIADVGRNDKPATDLGADIPERLGSSADEDDIEPVRREHPCRRRADAGSRARDDGDAAHRWP